MDPSFEGVVQAEKRIANHIRKTEVASVWIQDREVVCKLEYLQKTGAFKLRGAVNAISELTDGTGRVVTASAGNHGLGVVTAANSRGVTASVFVSRDARRAKVRKMIELGAEVREEGCDYDEAEAIAMNFAKENSLPFIHAFDDPLVIAGQGTVALEFLEQAGDIDSLIIPVGGGGLISGCALVAKKVRPGLKVYGVQPEESAPMKRALEQNKVVETPIGNTSCDALAGRFVSQRTLAFCRELTEDIVTVSEGAILAALVVIETQLGHCIEPSAAAPLAALMEHGERFDGKVGIVLTGCNIGSEDYRNLFGKG